MTKEEILIKHLDEGFYDDNDILSAMQEYADQECINFLKYVNSIPVDIRAKYTVEQLYQAYCNNEKLQ
jgi:hypothetical protein